MSESPEYIGRFAPSPTGPLHFGSLVAAVASYLDARAAAGRWLLRIEDIDPPRAQAGAADDIVRTLDEFGFEWDGPVIYQSASEAQHRAALESLRDRGLTYACRCSRRDLATAEAGPLGAIYPGTCRTREVDGDVATRVRTTDTPIEFVDRLQGPQSQRLESESGDFVILRRDNLIAYQLAVVVDDALQGITHVVRGIDLLPSTCRQIHLQQLLGEITPEYAHLPVVVGQDGCKLSKLTGAAPVQSAHPTPLIAALSVLGQAPPADLADESLGAIWTWAVGAWQPAALVGETSLPLPQ